MTRKHIISSLFGIMASMMALTLTGCAEEDFRFDEPDTNGRGITLSFSCNDMLPQYIDPVASRSRAADPKTEEEKKINSLHLFFFDSTTGDFVQPKLDDQMFLPYQYIPDATNLVTVGDKVFDNMTNVTVVAIANINATEGVNPRFCTKWTPLGDIRRDSRKAEGERWEIKNYSDLKQWIYHPRLRMDENRSVVDLPEAGMPMIGTLERASLEQSATNPRLEVQLKALMARVNITIKLNPNQESRDGTLPTMTITSYGIKNMPNTVPFTAPTAAPLTNRPADITESAWNAMTDNDRYDLTRGDDGDDSNGQEMTTDFLYELPAPVTINKNSAPVTFSYYTYENIQRPDYTATRPGVDGTDANFFPDYNGGEVDPSTIRYPDGIDEADRQRWKPLLARKDASAMVLNASYVTHQELRYQARFTIYMGQNPDNDFQVKRNHAYNNNISIRGLDYVRNSSDGVYTFDARVNVVSDNPVYLAIVNERKIDAHATVLPMDVWLLLREPQNGATEPPVVTHTSKVTLSVRGDARNWLSMIVIPRAEMEASGWKAGTGAPDYFYTDLIAQCNTGTFNGHQSGPEVTIESTPSINNSRSRVYFCIDENVPTSNNPTDYGDRYATIDLTYENSLGDVRTRTIEIDQRALVKVDGQHTTGTNITAWMEYYEEYLEHSDPLDQHTQPGELYEGLPWGVEGTNYGGWEQRWWEFNTWSCTFNTIDDNLYTTTGAFAMTKYIIGRQGADPLSNLKIFNDNAPKTAFHYCYGKNKRDSNGLVETGNSKTTGWYMPGIRELEQALTQHYMSFDDFRGNFYWSCAAAKARDGGLTDSYYHEELKRARATKVATDANGQPILNKEGKATYAESGSHNDDHNYRDPYPNGVEKNYGRAPRSKTFRIRAFYKAQ